MLESGYQILPRMQGQYLFRGHAMNFNYVAFGTILLQCLLKCGVMSVKLSTFVVVYSRCLILFQVRV